MSQQYESNSPLHRRREFLKSLAAAAGIAAIAAEQALGSSLLLRAQDDPAPVPPKKFCTASGTFTESSSWVLHSYETATSEFPPAPPYTMTRSFSSGATYSESQVETFTSGEPVSASYTRTTILKRAASPASTHSAVYTLSFNGTVLSMTLQRPFPVTMNETKTKTVSVSYPCPGGGSLVGDSNSQELLVGAGQVNLRRGTVDGPEDLFHALSRGGGVQHLNL